MIKKVIALFLILLAFSNIVILAHALIPHHSHKSEVCINNSLCLIHSDAHEQNAVDHTHEHSTTDHDHEHGGEYCISDQVFVILSNRAKLEWKYIDFFNNRINLNQFQANLPDHESLSSVQLYINNTQPTLIFSAHYQYFGSAPGLRAPPLV